MTTRTAPTSHATEVPILTALVIVGGGWFMLHTATRMGLASELGTLFTPHLGWTELAPLMIWPAALTCLAATLAAAATVLTSRNPLAWAVAGAAALCLTASATTAYHQAQQASARLVTGNTDLGAWTQILHPICLIEQSSPRNAVMIGSPHPKSGRMTVILNHRVELHSEATYSFGRCQ